MISDDGAGFDTDAVQADRLGLSASVRARIEDLGGAVRIFAKPGFGTSVLLTVPRAGAALLGTGA
jgi:signal transduction histidine kinase